MATNRALIVAAIGEIATGLALLVAPSFVARLLLGADIDGVALSIARITGVALIALGIACWPGPPLAGMLFYSAAVAIYLAWVGVAGEFAGAFLWPAVVFHAVLTALLMRAYLGRPARGEQP